MVNFARVLSACGDTIQRLIFVNMGIVRLGHQSVPDPFHCFVRHQWSIMDMEHNVVERTDTTYGLVYQVTSFVSKIHTRRFGWWDSTSKDALHTTVLFLFCFCNGDGHGRWP